MEHDVEKRIREKVQQVEATPMVWSKQGVWHSIREAEQPARTYGLRYVAAAASVFIALSFFSDDGIVLPMRTSQISARTVPDVMPPSSVQKEYQAYEPLSPHEEPLAKNRHDSSTTPSPVDLARLNHTFTPPDTPMPTSAVVALDAEMQNSIASQPTDSVVHPDQNRKIIHAIVGILETSAKDTLTQPNQKASRLKLFRRHERDLKNTLDEQQKSMTARIN